MALNRKIYLFCFSAFMLLLPLLSGQVDNLKQDKYTLLTMPYNLRPLSLYRGQFQADGGYKFAVRTHSYNSDGDIERITNKSTGSVYHYYLLNFRYGVTDFLELSAETNLIRRGQREETTTYISTSLSSTDRVNVNKLTEVRGMGDILVMATFRLPIRYRWFDISSTAGMYFPTSEYEPQQPSNTVTNVLTASSYTVNYHYNYTHGYGVQVYLISASAKIGVKKFTAEGSFSFQTPKEEGSNIRWEEYMVDKVFSYNQKGYKSLLSNSFAYDMSVHYQATGWFDVYLNGNYNKTKGGWTEYNGKKYFNEETSLLTLEPGFELQLSPTLKICQVAGFPLGGKNTDAPFYLFTTLRFSFFPFVR